MNKQELIDALMASQNFEDSLKALGMDTSTVQNIKAELKAAAVKEIVQNVSVETLASLLQQPAITVSELSVTEPVVPQNTPVNQDTPKEAAEVKHPEVVVDEDYISLNEAPVQAQPVPEAVKADAATVAVPEITPVNAVQVKPMLVENGYHSWLVQGDDVIVQTNKIQIKRGNETYEVSLDTSPISRPAAGVNGVVPVLVCATFYRDQFKQTVVTASSAEMPYLTFALDVQQDVKVELLVQGRFDNDKFNVNVLTTGVSVANGDTVIPVSDSKKGTELPVFIQFNAETSAVISFIENRYFGHGVAGEWDSGFSNQTDFSVKEGQEYLEINVDKTDDGWKVSY